VAQLVEHHKQRESENELRNLNQHSDGKGTTIVPAVLLGHAYAPRRTSAV
jgi:hypothetical protein